MTPRPGSLVYQDRFDRWNGPGNAEFRRHIEKAFATKQTVRLVMAHTKQSDKVDRGEDGSKIPKEFERRENLFGQVTKVDGQDFSIEFRLSLA